jgi:predicted dehydrogenase
LERKKREIYENSVLSFNPNCEIVSPSMMTLGFLGCGSRGRTYSKIAAEMSQRYKIVAVCDKVVTRAQKVAACVTNGDVAVYESDAEFFAQGKLADVLVIATQDADHFEHAKAAIALGYDILLEKPAGQTLEECEELHAMAIKHGVRIGLCFVLRYTPFYRAVKREIDSGRLGQIISIHASEGVDAYHQAHSYVRGHWRQSATASPMILAKSSHDCDLLCWFADAGVKHLTSYGSLEIFRAENAPAGAPARCTDGCPAAAECMYDAHRYLGDKRSWLRMVLDDSETADDERILKFLRESPWGRCVYRCDNDVVDHQVIAAEMENRITVTFTMTAFNCGRTLEIYGTKGSLKGGSPWKDAGAPELFFRDHSTATMEEVKFAHLDEGIYAGHGGGDAGIVDSLDRMFGLKGSLAPGLDGIEGHRFAFRAEASRLRS